METFFYIPNLIGYARILLLFMAYGFRNESFGLFALSYLLSFVMDAVDGFAARLFHQSSSFGAHLDMLTDRMGTLMLAVICLQLDSPLNGYLLLWEILDLTSHWLQTLVAAGRGLHHKTMNNRFRLLNLYYTRKDFMCTLCVGAEIFFVLHFYKLSSGNSGSFGFAVIYWLSFLLLSVKGVVHALQLASNALAVVEAEEAVKRGEPNGEPLPGAGKETVTAPNDLR